MKNLVTNRRAFLASASLGAVAPAFIPASALGRDGFTAPSERIVMAVIGTGGRGRSDMQAFMKFPQVQMVAVCDPVLAHRNNAKEIVRRYYDTDDCQDYRDFREVLDRKDIDAVLIGTPDHWHAIITVAACKAGKDVFCEKP
ncbi:MAG: Gfo/Idh/MocA family oxidoreductase, partial [Planctomycetes bacterium]|nr:Gfo/Idh/MocA family oxidoreductase [Planctomycetota bacterium]